MRLPGAIIEGFVGAKLTSDYRLLGCDKLSS